MGAPARPLGRVGAGQVLVDPRGADRRGSADRGGGVPARAVGPARGLGLREPRPDQHRGRVAAGDGVLDADLRGGGLRDHAGGPPAGQCPAVAPRPAHVRAFPGHQDRVRRLPGQLRLRADRLGLRQRRQRGGRLAHRRGLDRDAGAVGRRVSGLCHRHHATARGGLGDHGRGPRGAGHDQQGVPAGGELRRRGRAGARRGATARPAAVDGHQRIQGCPGHDPRDRPVAAGSSGHRARVRDRAAAASRRVRRHGRSRLRGARRQPTRSTGGSWPASTWAGRGPSTRTRPSASASSSTSARRPCPRPSTR